MKTALALLLLGLLSGCVSTNNLGYFTGTMFGFELSAGATSATPQTTLTIGYKRAEALVTPTSTTTVPSVLGKIAGTVSADGVAVGLNGDQFFAVGAAATALAEEIHLVE